MRILTWLVRFGTVFALALCLSGAVGIFLTGKAVFDAEDARQAAIEMAQEEASNLGWNTREFDNARSRVPTLIELLTQDYTAGLYYSARLQADAEAAPPEPEGLPTDVLGAVIVFGLSSLGFFLVAIAWVWRAHRNLEVAGLALRHGSSRAMAGFLIPVLNLVLPAEAMHELYNRSFGSDADSAMERADDVTAWFFAYIAGLVIFSLVLFKIGFDLSSNIIIDTPYWMELLTLSFAAVLLLVAVILFVLLARKISKAQRELLSDLTEPFGEAHQARVGRPRVTLR